MTVSGLVPPTLLELPMPTEPAELRGRLRAALLDGETWEERFGPDLGVGKGLWLVWGESLSGQVTLEQLGEVIRGYRRELWFWVLGDRMWTEVASGLEGRLVRRLPSP